MFSRWRALTASDRRALLPAACRLSVVRLSLALLGVVRTQLTLAGWSAAGSDVLQSPELWRCRTLALQRVAARVPDTRCLARSLTLWWWMRASGLNPELRMGVRGVPEAIQGHAWVECDGHVFDETPEGTASYTRLDWKSPQ